jgi:hypothetical protein
MAKIKHRRDVDCVVGGYRLHKEGDRVGSLLLGLYNDAGELHFIGHCSGFADTDRKALLGELRPFEATDSFGQGVRRPGEESRWSGGKDLSWIPLRPELVCEVSYDQLTGDRFRHATRFERWRPDKDRSSAPSTSSSARRDRASPTWCQRRRRDGCTRGGSASCFGKWGGHGASPRPSSSSRRASSSRASRRPTASSIPSLRSPTAW